VAFKLLLVPPAIGETHRDKEKGNNQEIHFVVVVVVAFLLNRDSVLYT
jgi:hypothetical protein